MTCSETDSFVDYLSNTYRRNLSEADLTLTTALDIVVAMETAARDASELQSKHGPSDSQIVHKLYVKNKSDRCGGTPWKFASKGRCNGDHIPQSCYYRDKECFK